MTNSMTGSMTDSMSGAPNDADVLSAALPAEKE